MMYAVQKNEEVLDKSCLVKHLFIQSLFFTLSLYEGTQI